MLSLNPDPESAKIENGEPIPIKITVVILKKRKLH